jgi:hypothetical protein
MLILFDHGAPQGVARALGAHTVITAQARGWDKLTNGALLAAAEEAAVDLLFTATYRPTNKIASFAEGRSRARPEARFRLRTPREGGTGNSATRHIPGQKRFSISWP